MIDSVIALFIIIVGVLAVPLILAIHSHPLWASLVGAHGGVGLVKSHAPLSAPEVRRALAMDM